MAVTKYTMYHSTVLDTDPDSVWAELRDAVRMVKILFGGAVENVRWADGGAPERVPSRYDFELLPGRDLIRHEVAGRDEVDRSLRYRSIARELCVEDYVGNYRVLPVTNDPGRSFLEYRREFTIAEDAEPEVVDALLGMIESQIDILRDYFATPGKD